MRPLPRTLPIWSVAVLVPAFAVVALLVGFVADALAHSGEVMRNTELAGGTIGGLGQEDLDRAIEDLAAGYADAPVEIVTPEQVIETPAGSLGLQVDVEATSDEALAAGRGGFLLSRPFGWIGSFFSDHTVPLRFSVDEPTLEASLQNFRIADAVEPALVVVDGRIEVDEGSPGLAIDPASVETGLAASAARGDVPLRVEAALMEVPPDTPVEPLLAVRAELDAIAQEGLQVKVDNRVERVRDETLASWFVVNPDGDGWLLDDDKVLTDLEDLFEGAGTVGGVAAFEVVDDEVHIVSAGEGQVCCAATAPGVVLDALRGGLEQPVELPLRDAVAEEARAAAEELGITELIGEFTTKHQCCESRVENIHRIADILRGYVIEPGDELSINGFIGPRTTEKGFVSAGVIENGVFKSDVGGGISQFATTIFNAAFFGGLDFGEYQSHSIYLSRYPYGREATLNYPHPDLVLRNTTPYGILVWPTYDDTSITVQLWSTKYALVEEAGQSEAPSGACRRVTTFRNRTYPDGREVQDSVTALYRPGEGLDCAGNRTEPDPDAPPPATTAPATTAPPATEAPTTAPPATAAPTTAPPPPPTTAPPATTAPPPPATTAAPAATTAPPGTTAPSG